MSLALCRIIDHHRLEYIQLKMTIAAATLMANIITHHLCAIIVSASHCFGLTFPGMMEEPGSLSGMNISQTAPGAGGKHPDIVGDLHQAYCYHL